MAEAIRYGDGYPKIWRYYIGDTEIEGPLDFDDVQFEFARDKDTDGVVMMPSVPMHFVGTGARLIRSWVYEHRTSEPLWFYIRRLNIDMSLTDYYAGEFSAETFVDKLDRVEIQTEQGGIEAAIRANAGTQYEIPTDTGKRVSIVVPAVTLQLEALNIDGRVDISVGETTILTQIPIPLKIWDKIGDPLQYRPAAPDILEVLQDGDLTLGIDTQFMRDNAGAITLANEEDNLGRLSVSGSGSMSIRIDAVDTNGNVRQSISVGAGIVDYPATFRGLQSGDLITAYVELESLTINKLGGLPGHPEKATLTLPTFEGEPAPYYLAVRASHSTKGAPDMRYGYARALPLHALFAEVCRNCAGNPSLVVVNDSRLSDAEPIVVFSESGFRLTPTVATGTIIKTSYKEVRSVLNMLGVGVVYERTGTSQRVRLVNANTSGSFRSPLWPVHGAQIVNVGKQYTGATIKANEASLFSAIKIGWTSVKPYKVIPYYTDPCGVAEYINTQTASDTIKDLSCKWRADGLGLSDLIIRQRSGETTDTGDAIWIVETVRIGNAYHAVQYGSDYAVPGVSLLLNMGLRPAALMDGLHSLLGVPVALLADKTYTIASQTPANALTVGGVPDTAPITPTGYPTHLPLYIEATTGLRDNLVAALEDPTKRYGYFRFDVGGGVVYGYIWALKFKPGREAVQRAKLYIAPDTNLQALIR